MSEQTIRPPRWLRSALDRIESDSRLERPGGLLIRLARPLADRASVAAVLRGDFMGHALHPLLTDVPIGAWLSAAVLDLTGGTQSRPAATRLTGLGLCAAVPTVASGLVELTSTSPEQRRVGTVHALCNAAAAGCYLVSYVQRKRGHHVWGAAIGLAAAAALGTGGYLGGHLTIAQKVGSTST